MTKQSPDIYERLLRCFAPRSDMKLTAFTLSCKSCLSSLSLLPGIVSSALSSLRLSDNRARSLRSTPPYAFTLSETLIALVIIGIVAALTVPIIVQHAQKREIVERLKKNYALFTEVTNKIIAEEGSPKDDWGSTVQSIYERYKRHLSIQKDCGSGAGCIPQTPYLYLDGTSRSGDWNNMYSYRKIILADGTQIVFTRDAIYNTSCDGENYLYGGDDNVCATILLDVNGERKPNQIGKDVFSFALKPDGLHPMGCGGTQCKKTSAGYGCTCKVLKENAINY